MELSEQMSNNKIYVCEFVLVHILLVGTVYIPEFAVFLTCPFSYARGACYRELSVWDFATVLFCSTLRRYVPFMYSRASCPFSSLRVTAAPPRLRVRDARYSHAASRNLYRMPQWVFVPIWVSIGPAVWAPMLDMQCSCTHTHTRARTGTHTYTQSVRHCTVVAYRLLARPVHRHMCNNCIVM
jgi:hypothetical protein